jgi:hypothetical protein
MKRFLAFLFLYLASFPAHAAVPCSLPFNLQNGQPADANQVMANYNALVACLANAAAAGSNSDITALNSLTTPITAGQGGTNVFLATAASTGSANVQIVASTTPNTFVLASGTRVVFVAGFTNTGPTTLNVHSTGVTNVFKQTPLGPVALSGNEIVAGQLIEAIYDGTQYQLVSTIPGLSGGYGPVLTIASAPTTDLGTITTHNASVTGGTTITSFGSSASTTFPVYLLTFTGAATLTYNAISLILPGQTNIVTATGDTAVANYLGSGNWQILGYSRINGTAVVSASPLPGAVGLRVVNNAGTPTTLVDYSADYVNLVSNTNVPLSGAAISGTINTTNSNVINGIDGSRGISTWYKIFILSNGTAFGGYASSNATTTCTGFVTLPAGYNYCVYVGSMRTDSSGNFLSVLLTGNHGVYAIKGSGNTTNLPVMTTAASSGVWTAVSTTTFIPPSATRIKVGLIVPTNQIGTAAVAPNNFYSTSTGGASFAAGESPCAMLGSSVSASSAGGNLICEFSLESSNVYWIAGSASFGLLAYGWTDKVNAN